MAIIKKFNDIALEFGMRISHKVIECKYPSGNIARFYNVNVMKDTHLVQHLEWKIDEVKNEVDTL